MLLAFAMRETHRRGAEVWKYSCLPLLFYSGGGRLGGEFRDAGMHRFTDMTAGPINSVQEMEEEARRVKVRLGRGGKDGAWILQQDRGGIDLAVR